MCGKYVDTSLKLARIRWKSVSYKTKQNKKIQTKWLKFLRNYKTRNIVSNWRSNPNRATARRQGGVAKNLRQCSCLWGVTGKRSVFPRGGRHVFGVPFTIWYSAKDEDNGSARCGHGCCRHLHLIVLLFDNDRQLSIVGGTRKRAKLEKHRRQRHLLIVYPCIPAEMCVRVCV